MEFYREGELKIVARANVEKILYESKMYKTGIKKEAKETMNFDIFIAHSKLDHDIIEGLYIELEKKYDIRVYVDWIVDPQLSRDHVTTESALTIRNRMSQSDNLIYAVSNNMLKSIWTPWELGYFDGKNKPIAVLPILKDYEKDFNGAEYVGVYEIIDKNNINSLLNNLNNPNFF